ncbi:RrF2 family transcriptional regulator [Leptospira sp. GIMC2001]|uniref:RrF2 family transcriptional regulator n=1 Tax=Leptospira sp. GIMC2001 TaxID=1513297 RepID=UPI00234A3342|nr:Rrf2 family transcriptional regulator [Leptospira sp. GIMC2001]WCL48855.1 Rrf2 family transcriptional regulator [Leptospira sp. GIMC2001]
MHLSKYTDYSFRVLMYLGIHNDRLVTIAEVSGVYDISKNHLVKIVHHLAQSGLIKSVPGKKGGIKLGREPKQINLLDVIEITETNFDLAECFTAGGYCIIQNNCKLTKILTEALFSFFKVMGKYSLADLIRSDGLKSQIRKMAV